MIVSSIPYAHYVLNPNLRKDSVIELALFMWDD